MPERGHFKPINRVHRRLLPQMPPSPSACKKEDSHVTVHFLQNARERVAPDPANSLQSLDGADKRCAKICHWCLNLREANSREDYGTSIYAALLLDLTEATLRSQFALIEFSIANDM